MTKVFEDTKRAEFLLQIILEHNGLKVNKSTSKYGIKNLQGHSARLDILAIDQQNHVYNIEIQRSDHGAGVKRARYNSSLIDANVTEPGEQYEALNENYVIIITENDVLRKDHPIYHIERMVTETGEPFGDEEHIVYVNSQVKDETSLGKLMHDFACIEAKDMYYQVLADRVRYFKEDEKARCRENRNEQQSGTEPSGTSHFFGQQQEPVRERLWGEKIQCGVCRGPGEQDAISAHPVGKAPAIIFPHDKHRKPPVGSLDPTWTAESFPFAADQQ